jgi:hypothetical protein
LAVEYFVDKPSGSKEQNLSNIFCRQKAIKKDRIESSQRVKYILNAARGKFDYDLLSLLTVDGRNDFEALSVIWQ